MTRARFMLVLLALCAPPFSPRAHGGIGQPIADSFRYVPGQQLDKFIQLPHPETDARVDVHGNQVALTERSRCYQDSQLTCTTCHDVHAPERTAAAYSDKCLQCHQERDCGEFANLGTTIHDDCVDCHMPVQDSDLIISNAPEKTLKARMRNHWIKVYREAQ